MPAATRQDFLQQIEPPSTLGGAVFLRAKHVNGFCGDSDATGTQGTPQRTCKQRSCEQCYKSTCHRPIRQLRSVDGLPLKTCNVFYWVCSATM